MTLLFYGLQLAGNGPNLPPCFYRIEDMDDSLNDAGISSFIPDFVTFMKNEKNKSNFPEIRLTNETEFRTYLLEFLCSEDGKTWIQNFRFEDNDLACNETKTPPVKGVIFGYTHKVILYLSAA